MTDRCSETMPSPPPDSAPVPESDDAAGVYAYVSAPGSLRPSDRWSIAGFVQCIDAHAAAAAELF